MLPSRTRRTSATRTAAVSPQSPEGRGAGRVGRGLLSGVWGLLGGRWLFDWGFKLSLPVGEVRGGLRELRDDHVAALDLLGPHVELGAEVGHLLAQIVHQLVADSTLTVLGLVSCRLGRVHVDVGGADADPLRAKFPALDALLDRLFLYA